MFNCFLWKACFWAIKCYHKLCLIITGIYAKYKLRIYGVKTKKCKVVGIPRIINDNNINNKICFGNNAIIVSDSYVSHIGYCTKTLLSVEQGGQIIVGENVGMSMATLCALSSSITIGDNVLIGAGVKIYTSDYHSMNYNDRRDPMTDQLNKKNMPVSIGNDCFIGAGTFILKGVTIGDRCIIGAGSVVAKNIPSDSVAYGNPCIIKTKKI